MSSSPVGRPIGFRPEEISKLVNRDVVRIHAEEASFLWLLRDDAVSAPHYSVQDLADLDERVEAHLDGLRIAGDVGWEFAEEGLAIGEPGEVFAAGVLAFGGEDEARRRAVLEVAMSDRALERALISALGWLPFDRIESALRDLLASDEPGARVIGIAGHAVHRHDPGPHLARALADTHVPLKARGLKAAGELGRSDLLDSVRAALAEADEDVRFFAAWSAALLGDRSRETLGALRDAAGAGEARSVPAFDLAMRCSEPDGSTEWYRSLLRDEATRQLAARAAASIGHTELVADLIELMNDRDVSRYAGEAFSMITGVDLAYEDLEMTDEEEEAPEGDSSVEEDLSMDPAEDLPWPDPALVSRWWASHRGDFRKGRRYLRGMEIRSANLRQVLREGTQRQRAAAALELVLRQPGSPLFETRAPRKQQLKEMSAWTS